MNPRRRMSTYDPEAEGTPHMILPPTYALRPIQNRRSHCTSDKCTFAKSPICRVIRLRTATQKQQRIQKLQASPNLRRNGVGRLRPNLSENTGMFCVQGTTKWRQGTQRPEFLQIIEVTVQDEFRELCLRRNGVGRLRPNLNDRTQTLCVLLPS